MSLLFRILPVLILALFTLWIGAADARAVIPEVLAVDSPDAIIDAIQTWGSRIAALVTMLAGVLAMGLPLLYSFRRKLRSMQDDYETEAEERRAASAEHHEQIAQMNAVAPTPVLTIAPPINPPVVEPPK